ncbi:hypothetical protein NPIL_389721 [Nephila pilipes]|uniref:Uncharacterized protein n=1 Tax=Nephila pilipes TaxID=299642 RepID=A0A8X6QTF2_NEPPI|nr:hypothetical protein NPIL_389721 [Nephila pilipes]
MMSSALEVVLHFPCQKQVVLEMSKAPLSATGKKGRLIFSEFVSFHMTNHRARLRPVGWWISGIPDRFSLRFLPSLKLDYLWISKQK